MRSGLHMDSIAIGIAWCVAWGDRRKPQFDLSVLQEMRRALTSGEEVPVQVREIVDRVRALEKLEFPQTLEKLTELTETHSVLWESKIGLVYGGATKIKQYVFEAAKLPDIRGASALLDRINLVDIPAFFGEPQKSVSVSQWLKENFPTLEAALVKELLVYYKGGNILAFCPAAFVDDLANAIEKRYTYETLTANSCAVGEKFKLLEIRLGLLPDNIQDTFWLEKYRQANSESDRVKRELVKACFGYPKNDSEEVDFFQNRKSFNELTTRLAILFNQRRSGNDFPNRPSRRYPPMFETHPYLRRDESDRRSAIARISDLPGNPSLSESLVRKRIVGQIAKREVFQENLPTWFTNLGLDWQPTGIRIKSWVAEFEDYLNKPENSQLASDYYTIDPQPEEARSLREIGNASQGFVAYIYADGNNMGGYIQQIQTPQEYKKFSEDIFQATEQSVYKALAEHLRPHLLNNLTDPDNEDRNDRWIHPFEILAIGGDDVMLIVPADRALAIAKTIGEEFENILLQTGGYRLDNSRPSYAAHRYSPEKATPSHCKLSMSAGVLITAEDTPIYYAQKLTNQLLKSAKKSGKTLKDAGYLGGTIDFLVMKSVTMIASSIEDFRKEGLTMNRGAKLKLYAAPYTLHEIGGLIQSVKALQKAEFPKSQLYQIRSFLERGKQTTILNYRYFRTRLKQGKAELRAEFEDAWCKPKDKENKGNLAPWMFDLKEGVYETIWRELVDIYDFIEEDSEPISEELANMEVDS
ncbi:MULTISPECIES: type III-B CRISPR-associated protein Cas10/Cmr2 [unclassified Microcoleus]|uniref:type III-B CRISPR-associated protein Cas10/Cmr2 n=2 Tax=unclassified Microcoleus TaxID=2642155 RepID=UPI0025E3ED1F|nr:MULTISPECIES: type III-B CRISPR-associated protein Cas10/Cmr2 [unclassified Microcoleus]TAG19144.1 MAG: type III-B CRISPR-associated protein Cas10/Cmr2 [Oscillatoriales cyanobacterium]TAG49135.1 MAG: type III-B CRISPR-associated protein Cas10/Cmr2 [Oscillatoriales cyanobacterium]